MPDDGSSTETAVEPNEQSMSPLRREMDAARVLLDEVRSLSDTDRIDEIQEQLARMQGASDNASPEDYSAIEEGLSKKLQDLLMKRGTDADVRKAAKIFAGRYGQFRLDESNEVDRLLSGEKGTSRAVDSGVTREQLLEELDGENGILQVLIDRKMDDVSYPLAAIRRKLLSST